MAAPRRKKDAKTVKTKSDPKNPKKPVKKAPKARSLVDELAELDPALRKSVQPYVRIVAKPHKRPLPLWASKACDGRPYMPRGTAWPRSGKMPMLPVLQIDLADVPPLAGFPRKGLISIFWSEDFTASRVLYFPKIVRDVSKLNTDFSTVFDKPTKISRLFPYSAPMKLTFEKREGCVSWGDYRFMELVGGKPVVDRLWDSPHQTKIWDHVWTWSGSGDTRIGGYACPQQDDPRGRSRLRKFETLLLQLENDNFTHCYFIEPGALKRGDFSKILYYQACD